MENRVSRCITVTTVVDGQDGAPGKDGKGIISADIMFCLANSQSTAPADGSFTATSFADLNIKSTDANKYVWQCNKTTYTSGSPTYSGKVCLGKVSDFASVVEQYALGTASAATGTWQDNTPPSPTKGSYLWTRTKLSYTGGGETYSPSSAGICLGYYGSDGPQGDGAAEVYVSPGSITVPCNNSGSVVAQMQQRLSLSMYVGNKVATISSVTATCPTGVSVAAQGTSTKDVTITTSATADGMATGIVFTVVGTVDSKEYTATATVPLIGSKQGTPGPEGPQGYGIMLTLTRSYNESQWESISGVGNEENFSYTGDVTLRAGDYFVVKGISTDAHLTHVVTFICTNQTASIVYGICVSAVCDGKQGQKGDTGRMFYLCGTWPLKAPYTRDAYRCPVVYYGGKYWYLDADSEDGTRAPGATGVTIWKEATSFDMVFTDVLFAKEFAMLGSFIVSGDWLISTKGVLGSAESQDYTKFDPAYPDTSVNTTHTVNGTTWTGYNFVPNFAVDGLTGKSYMNDANIKGTVKADNLYHGVCVGGSEKYAYCSQLFIDTWSLDDNTQEYMVNFTVGNYYTESEVRSLSGNHLGIDSTGMVKCSYSSDIYIIPSSNNDTGGVAIYLPLATDFDGKLIEIVDTRYTQPSSQNYVGGLTVYQCDMASKMRGTFGATPAQYVKLNSNYSHDGGNYRLLSYEGYWVRLSTIGNV